MDTGDGKVLRKPSSIHPTVRARDYQNIHKTDGRSVIRRDASDENSPGSYANFVIMGVG